MGQHLKKFNVTMKSELGDKIVFIGEPIKMYVDSNDDCDLRTFFLSYSRNKRDREPVSVLPLCLCSLSLPVTCPVQGQS